MHSCRHRDTVTTNLKKVPTSVEHILHCERQTRPVSDGDEPMQRMRQGVIKCSLAVSVPVTRGNFSQAKSFKLRWDSKKPHSGEEEKHSCWKGQRVRAEVRGQRAGGMRRAGEVGGSQTSWRFVVEGQSGFIRVQWAATSHTAPETSCFP